MHLPLIGGSYTTRSLIAGAQRCVNLFPELNRRDTPVPTTHYQRPGLRSLGDPPVLGFGRCLYRSSNGQRLYAVVGQNIYYIDPSWTWHLLGQVGTNNEKPASFSDNGVTAVVVDGSAGGWTVDLLTNAFAQIVDSTGTFQGARKVDFIDTFLLFGPVPPTDSNAFISTTSNQVQFNPLFVGGKTDYPDPLSTLIVNRHEILLLGELKSEVWYDAGNPQLPFAELPGAFIEHGTPAPYSVASTDISVFWLGQDLQGDGVVFRQRGYETTRISNHALEVALRRIKTSGGDLSDCVAYTYQQDGHYFYVMNFPSGDQTWAFDDAVGEPLLAWHQRSWADADGVLHRDRVQCYAFAYGRNLGLDWETGRLYELDLEYHSDDSPAGLNPVQYVRTFPHLAAGMDENGRAIPAEGRMVQYHGFMLDIESGTIPLDESVNPALPPEVTCRYSDDRGRTFSGSVLLGLGAEGQFLTWPTLKGPLGQARDRIWEVQWIGEGATALNGAWVDAKVLHD